MGVEFLTPSVTARSFADTLAPPVPGSRAALRQLIARQNPHVRFFDLEGHGYTVVDVTPERVQADFWHVATVSARDEGERLVASWAVKDGEATLVPAEGPVVPHA